MIVRESPWKDAWRLFAWGPYPTVLGAVRPGVEIRLNERLGRIARRASPGLAGRIRDAMRIALGPRNDLDDLVAEAFGTHFANQYVGPCFAKVRPETVHDWVRFEGMEILERARESGGVVVAHAHMALPQLPLHALGVRGFPVHQVTGGRNAVARSRLGDWASGRREALEADLCASLHDARRYLRPLLRALDRGEIVFSACDGTGGGEELGRREVHIVLGQPMAVPVFPAWVAARSGATLLTMSVRRGRDVPIVARFEPPIPAAGATAALATRLDGWIRERPGGWHFWHAMHRGPGGLLRDFDVVIPGPVRSL